MQMYNLQKQKNSHSNNANNATPMVAPQAMTTKVVTNEQAPSVRIAEAKRTVIE
jgi:hypothetical protein